MSIQLLDDYKCQAGVLSKTHLPCQAERKFENSFTDKNTPGESVVW